MASRKLHHPVTLIFGILACSGCQNNGSGVLVSLPEGDGRISLSTVVHSITLLALRRIFQSCAWGLGSSNSN